MLKCFGHIESEHLIGCGMFQNFSDASFQNLQTLYFHQQKRSSTTTFLTKLMPEIVILKDVLHTT